MSPLCFSDPVYGETCVEAPLLDELYHTQAVQRLAHIYQGGVTAFIRPQRRTTRLDHSLGVMALLQRLGAGLEELAAGLLHDIGHTAFSHVIDFVFPNQEHTYHEDHRESMVETAEIATILSRHGLDERRVLNPDHYPLLEQPLPLLCADRLDYFLRDGVADIGRFSVAEAHTLLRHLCVIDGKIVVDDLGAARWLGYAFMDLDDVCWCSVQEVGWYAVMARALRAALEQGVLHESDFAGRDRDLWERLHQAHSPEIDRWLVLLRPHVTFRRTTRDVADLEALPKVRAIDPPVWVNGRVVPLSTLDPQFAAARTAYIAGKQGTWYLQIVTAGPLQRM